MGIFNSNSLRVISGADGLEFVIIEYQGKPYRISAADFITALGLSSGGGGVDEAALRASLGTLTGATDLGSFLGTTISNSATVKTALQQLETALEAMTADISGQFLGSAATFVALPTPAEASNGDWAVLTSDDGGNTSGIYVYDGTNYSFVMEIADSFTAAANAISPAADDATGAIGATTEYAREDHKHPAQGVSTDVNNILVVGSDGLHLLALDATGFAGNLDTDDDTLQEVAQKFDDYIPGKDRVFAPSTDVVVVTVGKPTAAELKVWNDGLVSPNTDTIIFYTGTITSTDAITYVYHIDKSGIVTLVQAPSTGGGIAEWDASTAYDAGEMVITPSKALVKRTAAGTSTATFDATEAADWTFIGGFTNQDVLQNASYYYAGQQIVWNGYITLNRTNSGMSTGAVASELGSWRKVGQAYILPFSPTTVIPQGSQIYDTDGNIWQAISSHTSAATFALDEANWTKISIGATDRVHADDTTVAPVTAGIPLLSEIETFVTNAVILDSLVYYTGSDVSTDAPTFVYNVDKSGVVTLLKDTPVVKALNTIQVSLSATTNDAASSHYGFDVTTYTQGSDLTLSGTGSIQGLKAGSTYKLSFAGSLDGPSGTGNWAGVFRNLTDGSAIGEAWEMLSSGLNVPESSQSFTTAFFVPTVDTEVGIDYVAGSMGELSANCIFTVEQVATTSVISPEDMLTNDQAASGYMDFGNMRMQWGVEASGNSGTITLPAPMSNTTYTVTATPINNNRMIGVSSHTTTTFSYTSNDQSGAANASGGLRWQVMGIKP